MTATASHPAGPTDPAQLTFRYTSNPDGWVTAQITEFPEAISQGSTEHEAYLNVLEALHDLTHEPTLAERLAFTAQARLIAPIEDLIEPLGGVLSSLLAAARDRTRDRVH
jgi:predicted RNase H-like HicB family nuclease